MSRPWARSDSTVRVQGAGEAATVGPSQVTGQKLVPVVRSAAGPPHAAGDYHLPGDVPSDYVLVKGGMQRPPAPGTKFSTSFGETLEDASAGVPHGKVEPTTAGQVRAGGGTVEVALEATRGTMNYQHADVVEGSSPTVFKEPIENPIPKQRRIGGPDYGK